MRSLVTCCFFLLFLRSLPTVSGDETDRPLAPQVAAETMKVPDGFHVTLFAGEPDVMQPIGFCIDDKGRLWVAEAYNYPHHGTKPGDRIIILEDTDSDGQHDKRTVFFEGLNYVSGIEVGFGGAWVMSPPFMYFIPDKNADDVPDGEPELLLDGFGNHANAHNMANGFAWGPDGWLYATHGRTNWSLVGKPGTPEEDRLRLDGGVWRYHPTRHIYETYADGTTNPWGIDWNDYGHAFICNCVNPHLFQVIQGAHYEPWRGRKSSEFAYQRIDTIADHLHFVGLGNVRNGIGSDAEDTAGGGHAHCGTMIYLGEQFPAKYRNQLFTNNIHGRRINNEFLRRKGSGYVASHAPDLMKSTDPWFMGVTLAMGSSGEVYVSDWSDTGECHSTRNTRKHTGRIYRITYDTKIVAPKVVKDLTDMQLVGLQMHDNEWLVRHGRRLLQERSASNDLAEETEKLKYFLQNHPSIPKKLRALWALHCMGKADVDLLFSLTNHADENIRSWAITLLGENPIQSVKVMDRLADMAAGDPSSLVRLSLASLLQRLALRDRWLIARQLIQHGEDANDQNLPLMIWYGIEPMIGDNLNQYVQLIESSAIPRIRINIARRVASSSNAGLERLCELLATLSDSRMIDDTLEGILAGLEGRRKVTMPKTWPNAYRRHANDRTLRGKFVRVAMIFSDAEAIEELKSKIADAKVRPEERCEAIQALVSRKEKTVVPMLVSLVDDPGVRSAVIQGLASFDHPATVSRILESYQDLDSEEKQIALATLSSRPAWAGKLLSEIESGVILPSDLTAYTARQIRSLGDNELSERLNRLWGDVRETPKARAKQIANFKKWLKPDLLADADLANGKAIFTKQCAACHRFFGEGGKIGPDITGAQRTNIDYLLENIVDPSASVSKDYVMHVFQIDDGRVVTGLIESRNKQTVAVLTTNDRIVIPIDEIDAEKKSELSLMPNGMLDTMSEHDIRDLFGYLQRK